MRRILLAHLVVSACTAIIAGCGSDAANSPEARATVSFEYPDTQAQARTSRRVTWVLQPSGQVDCQNLLTGETQAEDALSLGGPAEAAGASGAVEIENLPTGGAVFFAQAEDASGARFMSGCTRADLEKGDNLVTVVFESAGCIPGQSEIPGNGLDDDCDGLIDECLSGAECDDGNDCTRDACLEGVCRNTAVPDGLGCDDGRFCTTNDLCQAGTCGGEPLPCNDGDECTNDRCDERAGQCLHQLRPRPGEEGPHDHPNCLNGIDDDCDGLTDQEDVNCQVCSSDGDCDDASECTDDVCVGDACQNNPVLDGSPCTGSDSCSSQYVCRRGACLPGASDLDADSDGFFDWNCPGGSDCDDSNPQIHPGAEGPFGAPSCLDGIDNDCDGMTDLQDLSCKEQFCTGSWCWSNPLPMGNVLYGVWTFSPNDTWAVGASGTIIHWDGVMWTDHGTNNPAHIFAKVWGSGPDDVWVVGHKVMHWDGSEMSEVDVGIMWGKLSVWGSGPDDVWIAADQGTVAHFDGSNWTTHDTGTTAALMGVWGSGPDDVWVVGGEYVNSAMTGVILHYDGNDWTRAANAGDALLMDVWGTGPNDIWAAPATANQLMHYSNGSWSPVQTGFQGGLGCVWGESPDEVWASGDRGTVLRYDGAIWEVVDSHTIKTLFCIRGSGSGQAANVWAVGEGGAIEHWQGAISDWSHGGGGVQENIWFTQIWGSSANDVWVTGMNQLDYSVHALHMDGAAWHDMLLPIAQQITGIWGSGPNDVWMVSGGGILHYDGVSFQEVPSPAEQSSFSDIHGSGRDLAWAAGGGTIARWDGESWSLWAQGFAENLTQVWGSGPNDVWVLDATGNTYHYDGATWWLWGGIPTDIADVFVVDSTDYWLAERYGNLLRYNGQGLSGVAFDVLLPADSGSGTLELTSVWASSHADAWLATRDGRILHYNGSLWEVSLEGISEGLISVWGTGPQDVWTISRSGYVYRYDGTGWVPASLEDPYVDFTTAAWVTPTDAWAADRDDLYHWDGTAWTQAETGIYRDIYRIFVIATDDIWAVGEYETAVHYNGATWEAFDLDVGTLENLRGLWASGPNDVWVTGDEGSFRHYNGTFWHRVDGVPAYRLSQVWGSGPDDVWVAGQSDYDSAATLWRYDGTSWEEQPSTSPAQAVSIWGDGTGTVMVFTQDGIMYSWDSGAWSQIEHPLPVELNEHLPSAISWRAPDDAWVVSWRLGGGVLHYDGTGWDTIQTGSTNMLSVIWASPQGDVWAAGTSGTIMHRIAD